MSVCDVAATICSMYVRRDRVAIFRLHMLKQLSPVLSEWLRRRSLLSAQPYSVFAAGPSEFFSAVPKKSDFAMQTRDLRAGAGGV